MILSGISIGTQLSQLMWKRLGIIYARSLQHVFLSTLSIFLFTTAVLLIFTKSAYADDVQKFSVKNNGTILAIISGRELSRFVFEQDRIKHIYAISGEIYYELLDENLYIRPNVNKPINFFVSTDKGRTYKIIATPKDIPATQISISPQTASRKTGTGISIGKDATITHTKSSRNARENSGELNSRHKIARVIKAILSDDRSLDYRVEDAANSSNYSSEKDIEMLHISIWSNQDLCAYKYSIHNLSESQIRIDKSRYLEPGIEAVYAAKEYLAPNETTILITVERRR